MHTILWALLWWLAIGGLSLAGIGFLLAWDWFFWKRLPWARWRASQMESGEWAVVREAARLRRLRNGH